MQDPVRAGLTSIKMFMEYDPMDFDGKIRILEDAKVLAEKICVMTNLSPKRFFNEGLSIKSPSVPGSAAALPDSEVSKYAQTTNLQIEVVSFFQSQVM